LQGSMYDGKIEEIRRRTDIVSLIGEYVSLKKAGKNYIGLCPFHQEKTPSFTVSAEKQIFHCFGCGEHGDAFSFLMKINSLTFPEAVRQLAKKAGVDLPQRTLGSKERESYTIREKILIANGFAVEYFVQNLRSHAGAQARDYLKKRGIMEKAVEEFRIGFARDEWEGLLNFLELKEISPEVACQAGLVIERAKESKGGHYDRFRGRIIIPIEDSDGQVVAFGGRVMDAASPKYLNSPESPVYTKGNNLFGLSRTKDSIRGRGFALLVEGYFDLISLWSFGIKNVAATLGTALTRSQVDLLGRYAKKVAAVFDPDEAGRKALSRSLELFLAGNVQAMAVMIPAGYDPDSFVRTEGREKMEELIAGAQPMADYYIEEILGAGGNLEEDKEKLKNAVAFIKKIDDAVERNLFIKKISQKLSVDQDVLKKEVGKAIARFPSPQDESSPRQATGDSERLELSFIHMLFEYPSMIPSARDSGILTFFKSEELKTVAEILFMHSEKKGEKPPDMISLLNEVKGGPFKEDLYRLLVGENPYKEELKERLLSDTMRQIRHRWYKQRHRILKEKIAGAQKAGDKQLWESLLLEKEGLLNEEKTFK
jgi:DNA primase